MYSFQYSEPFLLNFNKLNLVDPYDDTVLFSAVNLLTGQSIELEFINSVYGYELYTVQRNRLNGKWIIDVNSIDTNLVKSSSDVNDLLEELRKFLNPSGSTSLAIAIPHGEWSVSRSVIRSQLNLNSRTEILFFAFHRRAFVEVAYLNATNIYAVCIGESKYNIQPGSIFVPDVKRSTTSNFSSVGDVINFIQEAMLSIIKNSK